MSVEEISPGAFISLMRQIWIIHLQGYVTMTHAGLWFLNNSKGSFWHALYRCREEALAVQLPHAISSCADRAACYKD